MVKVTLPRSADATAEMLSPRRSVDVEKISFLK
jgi:hypothetical protein